MAADISAELDLELAKFNAKLKEARAKARSEGGMIGGELMRALGTGIGAAGAVLATAFAAVLVPAAAAATAGTIAAVKAAAAQEQTEIAFEVIIGNKAEAEKAISDLKKLAEKTPLSMGDLAGAGRKLLAFGSDAGGLPEELRRIGDISTAIQAPIGEIAEIYGKARVQGRLFAEDLNQLTGRGIPILQEFAAQLGVGTDQIKKMASDGKIGFENLAEAFRTLTEGDGRFAGMMERMSGTFNGLISTLKDRFQQAFVAFGEPVRDALKPLLESALTLTTGMAEKARQFGEYLATGIRGAVVALKTFSFGEMLGAAGDLLIIGFQKAVNFLYKGIMGVFAAAGSLIVSNFTTLIDMFRLTLGNKEFWQGIGSGLLGLAHQFSAVIQDAVASLLEGVLKIPGASKIIPEDLVGAFREAAEGGKASAAAAFENAGQKLADPLAGVLEIQGERLRQAKDAFLTAFANTGDLLKISPERLAQLQAMAQEWKDAMKGLEGSAKTQADAAADGGGSAAAGGNAASGKGAFAPGALAAAVNLLAGRTMNQLIIEEQQRGNALLGSIDSTLKAIRGEKPKPQAIKIEPVFA